MHTFFSNQGSSIIALQRPRCLSQKQSADPASHFFYAFSFFSFCVHTSASRVFPLSSLPLILAMASVASSAVLKQQTPLPPDMMLVIPGFAATSPTCFSRSFHE